MGKVNKTGLRFNRKYAKNFIIRLIIATFLTVGFLYSDDFRMAIGTDLALLSDYSIMFYIVLMFCVMFCYSTSIALVHYFCNVKWFGSVFAGIIGFYVFLEFREWVVGVPELVTNVLYIFQLIVMLIMIIIDVSMLFGNFSDIISMDGKRIKNDSEQVEKVIASNQVSSNYDTDKSVRDEFVDNNADKHTLIGSDKTEKDTTSNVSVDKYFDDYKYESFTLEQLKSFERDGSTDPDREFEELVGLKRAKQEVKLMESRIIWDKDNPNENNSNVSRNMFFVGNPSIGKTTMAKIVTGILFKYGYLKENKFLDLTPDNFKKTNFSSIDSRIGDILHFSLGKVLFIDETYELDNDIGSSGCFGEDAISILMKELENKKREIIAIFAGNKDEIENIKKANPEWQSVISREIVFENTLSEELFQAFIVEAKKNGFSGVTPEFQELCLKYFEKKSKEPKYDNEKDIKKLVNDAIDNHAYNNQNGKIPEQYKHYLCESDFPIELKSI